MEFSRFERRRENILKRQEDEHRARETRWRQQMWMAARTMYHALTQQREPPTTKEEHDRQEQIQKGKASPPWGDIQQARMRKDEHDQAFLKAISHPYNFEEYMFMADHYFPEPPPEKVRTAEQIRQESERERQEALAAAAAIWQ